MIDEISYVPGTQVLVRCAVCDVPGEASWSRDVYGETDPFPDPMPLSPGEGWRCVMLVSDAIYYVCPTHVSQEWSRVTRELRARHAAEEEAVAALRAEQEIAVAALRAEMHAGYPDPIPPTWRNPWRFPA